MRFRAFVESFEGWTKLDPDISPPNIDFGGQAPIVYYRRIADRVEAKVPPPREGHTRLWRGNRPGEEGKNPSYTNSLPGIALPFLFGYGGKLTYVDVPDEDLPKYERHGAVAAGSEFMLPAELVRTATVVDID